MVQYLASSTLSGALQVHGMALGSKLLRLSCLGFQEALFQHSLNLAEANQKGQNSLKIFRGWLHILPIWGDISIGTLEAG